MSVDGMGMQLILFDYASLDDDDRVFMQDKASETRGLLKRASEDIIQIGRNLIAAKDRLPKGQFIPWVKSELGISQPTAWRFMQVAKGRTLKSFNMNEIVVLPPVEPVEDGEEVRLNRMTKEEKRQKVVNFFAEFPQLQALSNREIAKRCGVEETLVRTIKKEVFPPKPPPPSEPELPELPDEEPVQDPVDELPDELAEEPPPESPQPTPNPEPVMTVEPEKGKEPEPPQAETAPSATKPEQSNPPKTEPSEAVKLERDIKRQAIEDRNEELREKGADLPQGKYACLVVDPPWQMEKIEREERPNQMGFDYPTMTEAALKEFPLSQIASDDCHMYLSPSSSGSGGGRTTASFNMNEVDGSVSTADYFPL
jgi:Protein of unknown function (DUF3102)